MSGQGPSVTLLGEFALDSGGGQVGLPREAQRLVAYLALDGQERTREHVARRLWPDAGEHESLEILHGAIWWARRVGAVIWTGGKCLQLSNRVSVDVNGLLALIQQLLDRRAPCPQHDLDETPLTKELLPDWLDDDWVVVRRERLRQLCSHGLEALCHRLLAAGRPDEAVEAARAAVRVEPLREQAQRALIAAYVAQGYPVEAARQFRAYRELLWEELRLRPSAHLTDLVEAYQLE
jgi:DNA-binding SARP family transcriptional activator